MPRWPPSTSNALGSMASGTTPSHQTLIRQTTRLFRDVPLDKALDGFHVADHDRPLAEIDQAPAMPVLEDLVNAFPAAARHVAELALRDVQFDRRTGRCPQTDALDELQQCFGDPRLEGRNITSSTCSVVCRNRRQR